MTLFLGNNSRVIVVGGFDEITAKIEAAKSGLPCHSTVAQDEADLDDLPFDQDDPCGGECSNQPFDRGLVCRDLLRQVEGQRVVYARDVSPKEAELIRCFALDTSRIVSRTLLDVEPEAVPLDPFGE